MGHHQIHHHHHPQVVHHQTTPHGTVVPGGHYGGNPGMMQLAGPPHVPTVTTTGTNPAHHTNGPSATTRHGMPTVPVSVSDRTAEGTLPSSTMEKQRVDGGESARGSTPGTSSASSSNEPTQTPPPHVQSAMPVAYANAGYYPVPGVGGRGMHAAPLHGQHPGQYVPPPQMVHGQPIPVRTHPYSMYSVSPAHIPGPGGGGMHVNPYGGMHDRTPAVTGSGAYNAGTATFPQGAGNSGHGGAQGGSNNGDRVSEDGGYRGGGGRGGGGRGGGGRGGYNNNYSSGGGGYDGGRHNQGGGGGGAPPVAPTGPSQDGVS